MTYLKNVMIQEGYVKEHREFDCSIIKATYIPDDLIYRPEAIQVRLGNPWTISISVGEGAKPATGFKPDDRPYYAAPWSTTKHRIEAKDGIVWMAHSSYTQYHRGGPRVVYTVMMLENPEIREEARTEIRRKLQEAMQSGVQRPIDATQDAEQDR